MTKAKICKTAEGKYVVKVRFLYFWWRAVDVKNILCSPNLRSSEPVPILEFIPERLATTFSSEYAASFFLEEVNNLLK